MRANDGTRTAAEVLVDQLVVHGVRHVFCVPGESYLAALDAFHDRDIAEETSRLTLRSRFMTSHESPNGLSSTMTTSRSVSPSATETAATRPAVISWAVVSMSSG